MTKFSSKDDPDYQNLLSEMRRFLVNSEPQNEAGIPSAVAQPLTTQASSQDGNRSKTSAEQQEQIRDPQKNNSGQQINHFSGRFESSGGKMIMGGVFNSGGGAMTF